MLNAYTGDDYISFLKSELLGKNLTPSRVTGFVYERRESINQAVGTAALSSLSYLPQMLDWLGVFPQATVWEKLEAYENYQKKLKEPQQINIIPSDLKTERQTYNHVNDYILSDNGLGFFRKRGEEDSSWKPFFIPVKASEIYCDGANLAVVAEKGSRIFTKKILLEYRDSETKNYSFEDLTQQDNWRYGGWFNLPVLSKIRWLPILKPIFNLISEAHLIKPESGMIAFSHRGLKNFWYRDPAEKTHYDTYGTSQMTLVSECGYRLFSADPWDPRGFVYEYKLPDFFQVKGHDISASTLFLMGISNQPGKEKSIKLYLRHQDCDINGENPFYWVMGWYTTDKDDTDPKKMFIPPVDWVEVELPEKSLYSTLSKRIGISQIDEGNDARLLTIRGKASDGTTGYFKKTIPERSWTFVKKSRPPLKEEDLIELKIDE